MEVPIPGPQCETSINLKHTLTPLITVSIVQHQIPLSLSSTRAMAGHTITITADNLSQVNNSITPLQVITNPTNPVPDIRWDHRLLMAILQGSDLKVLEGIPTPTPRLLGHWAITDPAIRLDRKAMVINQVGEAPTTVPQGRRGNPYNIKFPNQPPQSPHTYPCHERANELISYAIGTTPVGPLGRNSSTDSGGIGPICSPRIGTGGASPSLYRHKGRQLFSDDFSSSCEFDHQSTSSGGYQSRDSQHSRDLDTPPASLRPETATWIWENFKALRDCVGKPEEMVKMAQPLFNIPENERWPASVVMQLCWLGSFADIPQVALEKAAALKGQPFTSLTTFITTTVRRVLLSPELDSFSRQSSLKNAGGKTPYSLVKDAIDAQSTGWLETHLSVKWREVGELDEKVKQAIIKRLKSDKNVLATIIKSGLANPNGVPRLRKLVSEVYGQMHSRYKDVEPRKIAGDKEITSAARARLAYLRLLIHLNQLEHERVKGTKNPAPPHFWTAIEEDLARCVGKPAIYKVAFGLLIIAKDRALWGNSTTLAKDITADQAAHRGRDCDQDCQVKRPHE
ncbi:hypothetical protein H4Q26_016259 [Puccinia striiformis f. sp. tritici PST-130]|nr:hypothetical protein H4Q26_016259 [Puccinia striiformis f. sp. tritici PST-130]